MTREYGRNKSMRRRSSGSRQFLQVMMAFLTGYLVASFFDFASLSHWANTRFLTQSVAENPSGNIARTSKDTALPKPKFEFYTLLANGRTQVASAQPQPAAKQPVKVQTAAPPVQVASTPAGETPVRTIPGNQESWVIQVGSFKTMPEAERMKAALILKGYTVNITSISQPQGNWFRVLIGPYTSQNEAQQAHVAFSRNERVVGMIRKA